MKSFGILVLLATLLLAANFPATATAAFGFLPDAEGFEMIARGEGGDPAAVAGSHPYSLTTRIAFNSETGVPSSPDGDLRNLRIGMPPGLLLNPAAPINCSAASFHTPRSSPYEASRSGESCPDASQVGVVDVHTGLEGGTVRRFGLFALTPAAGFPAQLGFAPFGQPVVFGVQVQPNSEGAYSFALEATDVSPLLAIRELDLTIWGNAWGHAHDVERGNCLNEAEPNFGWSKCPVKLDPRPYLTMPTDCSSPLAFTATASSWQQPAQVSATYLERDGKGQPTQLGGCSELVFKPAAFGQLNDHKASSSSGFVFELLNDETGEKGLDALEGRIRAQVRGAVASLPEGVTINPSLGAGLGVCTPAQYAATSAAGGGCPNVAKIGSFSVRTPLFGESLEGGVYLAQPDDRSASAPGAENPFDSLLAIYLIARSSQRGILVKVAGRLDADPSTGRLTASFDDLPQIPYTSMKAEFRSGQRAPLITPAACGTFATRIELSPWAGGAPPAVTTTNSKIESGIGTGPCPSGATPAFAPGITAGSVNSNVGSYTPFYLHLTRKDDEQEITSYSAVLPRGITGRLAGIPFCSDAAIAAARNRTGGEETANPSCPAASQVGRTLSGYGVGPALAYAPGRVYLAGPYHGSPLSLVTINAATVGPFDLGTIVIRSAFEVDSRTAQLRIDSRGSDPIPHIVDGIPLHLRDIRVFIDRPQFTRNPTSCERTLVTSTLTGSGASFGDTSDDTSATVSNHFQLLNCRNAGFRPRLGLRLRGGSRRGDYPSLRATFAARPGDANLQRIAVTMPHSEFLAQNHIRAVCTRPQFAAEKCPSGSAYGRAVAYTPLFDQPLSGPVYLVSSANRLPDLVASLHSGAVHIVLGGRISPANGGIRTFFTELPDAEISRFVLQLRGGERGLLVNSSNICAAPPLATVKALGQNNLGRVFTTKLRGQCKPREGRGKG